MESQEMNAFDPLHPQWMSWLIAAVLPAVAIAQWILIVPMARRSGCFSSIDHQPKAEKYKFLVPFTKDYFFIAWNSLPLILLGFYYSVWRHWDTLMATIRLHFDEPLAAPLDLILELPDKPLFLLALALLSVFAAASQHRKIKRFRHEESFLYWWDPSISRRIFNVRAVALIFNFFTVAYVFSKLVFLTGYITFLPYFSEFHATLGHPDGYGGLAPLGRLCITIAVAFAAAIAIAYVGMLDHRGEHGALHRLGDLGLSVAPSLSAALVLVVPNHQIRTVILHEQLLPARAAFARAYETCLDQFLAEGAAAACPLSELEVLGEAVLNTQAGILRPIPLEAVLFVLPFLVVTTQRYLRSRGIPLPAWLNDDVKDAWEQEAKGPPARTRTKA
jgi:hypothetical protein